MSELERSGKTRIFTILGSLGAIIPLFSLAFSAYQFVNIEDTRLRQQSFENYHSLISKLGLEQTSSTIASATIYEMKNYPEYCEISLKIIDFYKGYWKGADPLSEEAMDLVKPRLEKECKK